MILSSLMESGRGDGDLSSPVHGLGGVLGPLAGGGDREVERRVIIRRSGDDDGVRHVELDVTALIILRRGLSASRSLSSSRITVQSGHLKAC